MSGATVTARLRAVQERIDAAAGRAGRASREIELVAVSKFQPVAAIEEAFAAGQVLFGENRVQEAEAKAAALSPLVARGLRLELIGNLQSNKVRKAVASVARIQSIDSLDLGLRVARVAAAAGRTMPVFVQVDLAAETTKHGVPADDLLAVLEGLRGAPGISVDGLMVLPPLFEGAEAAERVRPFFARLRSLRDQARERGLLANAELSMGMSHDFETAIEEGATVVRVGTAIFGERPAAL